jgi:hypothetical protein
MSVLLAIRTTKEDSKLGLLNEALSIQSIDVIGGNPIQCMIQSYAV